MAVLELVGRTECDARSEAVVERAGVMVDAVRALASPADSEGSSRFDEEWPRRVLARQPIGNADDAEDWDNYAGVGGGERWRE